MTARVAWVVLPLALLLVSGVIEAAKILGVLPIHSTSHQNIGSAYMRALADAGHDVTVVSPFPRKNAPDNYRDIELTGMVEKLNQGLEQNFFTFKGAEGFVVPLVMLHMLYGTWSKLTCEFVFEHPNVVKLLNSDEKFDLVIVESFVSESMYGFAQHFNAPLITYSTFGSSMWTNDLVGTPANPSHVAHFLLSFTDNMSFWERLQNAAITVLDRMYYERIHLPKQKRYYDKAFPNANMTFEEQIKNVSMVFLNQHFSLSNPRPYPPNMVEAGGIQVEEGKPLPEDLQKYLDEAEEGVIYFCMGSNVKSIHFPVEKREAFLKVFSKLKQRVLWKFEDETMSNQPANLMIKRWMPQNDILAHPNVKVFITHGGLLGSTEALYHGKPMIGIPIFGDQPMNVRRAVRAGFSVLLDYDDITEENVEKAISVVLNDPLYARNAKLVSERFRDKPMTPKQTAVYWAEYVVRHGGAPHMQSSAMDLSLLQYHLIDVYAVMLAMLVAFLAVNIYVGRIILRKVFKPKTCELSECCYKKCV